MEIGFKAVRGWGEKGRGENVIGEVTDVYGAEATGSFDNTVTIGGEGVRMEKSRAR